MRILYHHRTRAEDAQGVHIQEMVNAFRELGHEVEVAAVISEDKGKTAKPRESLVSRTTAKLPPLLYELLEILYNLYGFLLLARKVLNFRPHLIYERYALYNVAGILVSRLFRIPLILEVNAPLAYEKTKHGKLALPSLAEGFEKWICLNSYKTIVVSTPLKRLLYDIGVPMDHMVVIPNGINPHLFNPDISGESVRKRLGLDGKIILGFVGWFRKWHGLEELLRVYVDYGMQEKNIHLLLIGEGPASKKLEYYARNNDLIRTGVTFTGAVLREHIPTYIASFDLALQPDVTDYASPIKIFEYMSMGKGVIAPNKDNIREIVKSGYGGLFRAGDWDDMARTILKYAQSKEKTRELGEQAKNILNEKKYFWLDNARKTLALLEE
jgi:glycosyltransferase involved in cell wall biosynthesis